MPNPANRAEPSTSAAGGAGLHAVCDLQVVPVGAGSSVSEWVAAVVAMVAEAEKTGEIAAYRLHAGGTNLEGPLRSILLLVERIHATLHAKGLARIATDLRIGTRTDKHSSIDQRLKSVEEKLKEKEEESEDEGLILLSKRETADELKPGSPEGLSDSSVEIRLTDAGGTVVATGISAPPSPIASSPSATPPSASPRKLSTDAPPFMPRRSQSAINIASQSHPTGILRTASGNITEEGFRRERRVSLAPSPLSNPAEAPTGPDGVRPWRRKSQSTPSDDPPAPSWRKERQPSSGSIHSVSSSGSRRRPSGASIASLNMTSLSTATSSNSAPAEQAPAGFIPPAFAQGRRKSLPAAAFARLKSSPTPTNAINSVVAAQLHLISEQARHLQAQVSLLESTATEPESTIHPANHTSNPSLEVFLKHLPKHTSPPALYFAASNALPGVKSVTVPFSSRDFGYLEFDNAGHMHGALEIGEFGYEGKKISVEVKRGRA